MIWFRSIIFGIFLFTFTFLCSVACLISAPFYNVNKRYGIALFWSKMNLLVLKWLCGIEYSVLGIDHVLSTLNQPIIILSKHQSAWETIAFPSIFPKQLSFVCKHELLWIPFFGWALASMRMVYINRSDRAQASITVAEQGRKQIQMGRWMVIFPEGTRTKSGSHQPYRKGGVRLAIGTGANIIPVAHNAGQAWARNSILKKPVNITLSIGPVIPSEGKSEDQIQDEIEGWIEAEMRVIDSTAYLGSDV